MGHGWSWVRAGLGARLEQPTCLGLSLGAPWRGYSVSGRVSSLTALLWSPLWGFSSQLLGLCVLSPSLTSLSLLSFSVVLPYFPPPMVPPPSSSLSNPPLQFIFLPFLPHCFLCTTSFLLPTPRPPGNWRETRHYPAEVSPHPRTPGPHPLLPHHPTLTAGSQLCPAALGSKVECQGWACTR